VVQFAYGGQPRNARQWHLCKSCLEHFMPGVGNIGEDLLKKIGNSPDVQCGWTSYPPCNLDEKASGL
jgi:hypothetical protein